MSKPLNPKVTAFKNYLIGDTVITAEFSDTMSGFAFRLRHTDSVHNVIGAWCWHYESFATLLYGGKTYIMGSCYGLLPKDETPFELVAPTCEVESLVRVKNVNKVESVA